MTSSVNSFYPNQAAWIRHFNETHRPQFNRSLYDRDNYEVVDALKKVALSCQRDLNYIIKVEEFRVIEDYKEI